MCIIFKVFIELLQYCFCFKRQLFDHKACEFLAPQPGTEPTPPVLEIKVLTTGPPGKSLENILKDISHSPPSPHRFFWFQLGG